LVYVEEWNDFDSVENTIKKHHKEIACIICEPVTGNMAVIPPELGFLNHLRELCNKYNIALIFDEVKTGFRLAPGGAQEIYNVTQDLATFAKSLGNGYPIAAVVGKKEFMQLVGPGIDKVFHGGTYVGNPVSMTAANVTLDILQKKEIWDHLNHYGRAFMKGLRGIYNDNNVDAIVQGFPTMFQSMFTGKDKIINCREGKKCDLNFFALLQGELLRNGVMIDEDPEEAMYISYSHKNPELNKTLEVFSNAVRKVRKIKKTLITLK
ncbi:MAG: aminotransferase class III-fold pyridoxal phosphate-dependent enzyme, partial [Nanoarchaeota archaeon]